MNENSRIKRFKQIMKPCVPDAFDWNFIGLLKEKGFFTAPASIHHHGAYSGALFDHSLAVTETLLFFTEKLGHGEKSVIILQQNIQLTDEEMYCIRWHMGAFDDKENWNSYGRACTVYPNVLYTHTADMVAARILGV